MPIDPNLYRELSQPHESNAHAQEAVNGFMKAFEEARKKYRIPNVVMLIQANCIGSDGQEQLIGLDACYGDENNWEPMAAHLFGILQASRQERISKIIKNNAITRKGER